MLTELLDEPIVAREADELSGGLRGWPPSVGLVVVVVEVARLRDFETGVPGALLLGESLYRGVPTRPCAGVAGCGCGGGVLALAKGGVLWESEGRLLLQLSVMESEKRFFIEKAEARLAMGE